VSLKVLPIVPGEATLAFEMNEAEALQRVNEWGGRPLPLNASCWLGHEGTGVLYLRLRGAVAAVQSACAQLGGERIDDADAASHWAACRDQDLTWFDADADTDLWRLSVPQTAPVLDLPEPPMIEWHGGQRWVHAPVDMARKIRDMAVEAGGHATLFKPGATSAGTRRFTPLGAPLDYIHRELKRQFDPDGIFNRGRLSPDF
jgi:glycolate oxidase FAD binding subunit